MYSYVVNGKINEWINEWMNEWMNIIWYIEIIERS